MAEYIEEYIGREKLLAKIDEAFFRTDPDGEVQIGFLKCRAIIRETPATDVAPVVRCKDCTYAELYEGSECIYCTNIAGLYTYVMDDDYCSYGERKDDGA